jgi:hypothetical protein
MPSATTGPSPSTVFTLDLTSKRIRDALGVSVDELIGDDLTVGWRVD